MKGLSQDERRGFNKYKLNYNYISYNDKTGFYKKTKETSAGRYEQPSINHWKCEKCDSLFMALKELRRHKQEYHAY
jgi:hypothetical protein